MNRPPILARSLFVTGLVVLFLLFWRVGWAESNTIPVHFKQGLPYVRIGIMGCKSQPEMDVVLDTGASSSIIPYECMRKLVRDGSAMELESHSVVLADGREQQIHEFLIDGLMLGGCEIQSVRVLCCKDPALAFPPVLGVDILQRLRNLRIRLSPDGGSITFECPPSRPNNHDCHLDEGKSETEERDLTYTLRRPRIRREMPEINR